jgi:alkylation response protein AidB-like acyl-CoA dehydrogenase
VDLSFTDEQDFLREAIRGMVEREAPLARVREWVVDPPAAQPAPSRALVVRQGWTGIGIAEERGGQGGGTLELAILAEELGRGAVPVDGLYASLLAAIALSHAGGSDAEALVAALADGESSAALVAPGDRPADAPAAGRQAALVLGAAAADVLLGWDGEALDVHQSGDAAVTARTMLDRTRSLADVDLPAPPSARIEGIDAEAMATVAATAAVVVAADALGAAQRLLDMTVAYVGQRTQFGVPVGSFQAVKHAAAEMLVAIEGTRAAVYYAAWAVGAREPGAALDACVAKLTAARAATLVADRSLFLHGAVGYTWEHDLQLLFKRAKSDALLFGGPDLYADRIAGALELVPSRP